MQPLILGEETETGMLGPEEGRGMGGEHLGVLRTLGKVPS